MMEILVLGAVAVLFVALYFWSRKSEREVAYDKPGLPPEQGDALRFGIAVSSSQGLNGGR
jgi:hypothetical protein